MDIIVFFICQGRWWHAKSRGKYRSSSEILIIKKICISIVVRFHQFLLEFFLVKLGLYFVKGFWGENNSNRLPHHASPNILNLCITMLKLPWHLQ